MICLGLHYGGKGKTRRNSAIPGDRSGMVSQALQRIGATLAKDSSQPRTQLARGRPMTVMLAIGGVPVVACHFPYRGDSQGHDRHVAHRSLDARAWLLHGHVHERWKVRERMVNVGVDVWDFAPVAERELAELITQRP